MDTSSQAAEQMVRYSLEGVMYTLKLTGAGTERVAAALLVLSRDQQKTRGKTTLNTLLRSEKELTVFTVPQDRLRDFAKEAKRYGVLYCVLKEKQADKSAPCDILVKAEDAAKINRIVERLKLGQVAVVSQDEPPQAQGPDPIDQEIQAAEELLQQIFAPQEPQQENPTLAQTDASAPSGHGSAPSASDTEPLTPNQRPSVRAALAQIRREQQANPMLHMGESVVVKQQTIQITDGKDR